MVTSQQPSPGQILLFELFNEIGIIDQLVGTRFERALPAGLTISQFSVLNHFVRLGGERTPKQLADAFQVTKGAMTNTLSKLVAKGLVEIAPSETDGRSKIVTITAEGAAMRERAIADAVVAMRDVAEAVSEVQARALMEPLRSIRAWLDAHRDNPQ